MKIRQNPVWIYVGLVVLYLIISWIIPLNSATRHAYNLDASQAHIIQFIAIIPVFGVWFAAFYSYGRLQRYAAKIRDGGSESAAFAKIADGAMVLAWGLVAHSYAALILGGFADNYHGFELASVILQNYITLAFPLVAFWLIGSGARLLLNGHKSDNGMARQRVLLAIFAVIGAVFSYLIDHMQLTHHNGGAYILPTFWLLTTIVIPYLFAWFMGLTGAADMAVHARLTRGLLYRRSLNLLAAGLSLIIIASIFSQYITSLFTATLGTFSINSILLASYLMLFGTALGYILIATGTHGLQKIEEV